MRGTSSYWSEDDWADLMQHDPEQSVDLLWQQEIDEMEWRGWDPVFPADRQRMLEDYVQRLNSSDADMRDPDSDPYDESRPWEAFDLTEQEWEAMFP